MNIHEMDQAKAALRDMAELTSKYYEELLEQGFSKTEAITLVATWSATLMTGKNN